ncbi:hypothetical protein CsatA_017117 [Cannabis sativa]
MTCVTSASYAVLLNGKPLKKCRPSRGLRQGDPISPFLFLFCHDVLSRLLQKEELAGTIKGISIARGVTPISHLMFADDTMVCVRASKKAAICIKECIHKYEYWSGQLCSKEKSSILFSKRCSISRRREIESVLQIRSSEAAGFYLGNPMFLSKKRSSDFGFIMERLKKRLEGWRLKTLSYAGRMTAVNTVALALPVYSMSTFTIPLTLSRKMDALVRRFWWTGGIEKNHYFASKSWDSLCQPKARGGLGFRKFEDINKALVSKLAWEMASNDEKLWVKIFREKFCSWDSFWAVEKKASDPSIWKSIIDARQIILEGSCTVIANGRDTNIWWQPWIPWMGYDEFRNTMERVRTKAPNLRTVSDLIIHDHNQWNTRYVIFLFGHTVGKQIVTIDIVGGLGKDLVVWKRSPKGTFTVKEAYWQENEHKFGCTHESWKMIWSKELHPRASLFLWRMCSGALPTRDKIGSMENVKCVICEDSIESPIHVFFECHLAKTLWFGAPLPVRIDLIQGEDVKTRIMNLCSNFGRDDRLRILLCGYVVWDTLWHYRNSILHGGKNRDVPGLMAEILNRFSEMVANVVPDPMVPPQLVQQYQFGAPFNSKVLFSDGSFKDGCCGMAVIGLDRNNMEWHSICSSGDGLSTLEAELKAIALGLQWAVKSNWSSVTILSDCLVAVTALKGRSVPDWKLAGDFFKVLQLVDLLSSCTFLHVKRDCIFGVNDLAVQARMLRIVDSICLGDGLPPVNPIFFA